jgi:hypothetical protein
MCQRRPTVAELNARVVLAMLDDMLEPMTTHRGTHLSILRRRVERLRNHVAEYVEVEPETDDIGSAGHAG